MLTIRCQCGEVFHAEERHIGRAIKCWRCGQVLGIGAMPAMAPPPGPMESPTPTTGLTTFGRRSTLRWGMAALALVAVVMTGWFAVSLLPREQEQQQAVAPVVRPQAPAELASKPAAVPLPPPARTWAPPVNRLKTGTNISAPLGVPGRGTLRIHNGTSYDAALTLRDEDTNTPRRFVYLRAHEITTLDAIASCTCRLFFALGTDWDAQSEEFRDDASFSVFQDVLRFDESETDRGVEWATFSVTLHPVPEGKAKTTRLSKEEFERQLRNPAPQTTPPSVKQPQNQFQNLLDQEKPGLPKAGGVIHYTPGRPIVVTVRLNGRSSARLVLDTGADRSMIRSGSLIAAGVDLARPVARGKVRGVAGETEVSYFIVDSMEVGDARVRSLRVAAYDIRESGSDGLLGRDFLDGFNVSIDSAAGIIRLTPR